MENAPIIYTKMHIAKSPITFEHLLDSMVGDVNFFLKEDRAEAEVEIMVAGKNFFI